MKQSTDALPFDAIAGLNQDGSMTLMVLAPLVVVAGALVLIAVVRVLQSRRERAATESSLNE